MAQRQIVIDYSVPVRMRDGVTLWADVYRPAETGRYPALLARTPYNRQNPDCRGRPVGHQSSGESRLCGRHPGRARQMGLGGRVLPLRQRDRRWLRQRGMGCGPALVQWTVWACSEHLTLGQHNGLRQPPAPPHLSGHHAHGYRLRLPRKLDLPGRRVQPGFQPELDPEPTSDRSSCPQPEQVALLRVTMGGETSTR